MKLNFKRAGKFAGMVSSLLLSPGGKVVATTLPAAFLVATLVSPDAPETQETTINNVSGVDTILLSGPDASLENTHDASYAGSEQPDGNFSNVVTTNSDSNQSSGNGSQSAPVLGAASPGKGARVMPAGFPGGGLPLPGAPSPESDEPDESTPPSAGVPPVASNPPKDTNKNCEKQSSGKALDKASTEDKRNLCKDSANDGGSNGDSDPTKPANSSEPDNDAGSPGGESTPGGSDSPQGQGLPNDSSSPVSNDPTNAGPWIVQTGKPGSPVVPPGLKPGNDPADPPIILVESNPNDSPPADILPEIVEGLPQEGSPVTPAMFIPEPDIPVIENARPQVALVPEPDMFALLGVGLLGMGWLGRRKK
jgi:hypothetical protein